MGSDNHTRSNIDACRARHSAGDGQQEIIMSINLPHNTGPTIKFEYVNWVASDPLPRDKTQSDRLHEPNFRISTTDPMTGHDIEDVTGHPSLVDGDLTVYFDTEETRKAFLNMPLNHPKHCLPFPATDEDDRGG